MRQSRDEDKNACAVRTSLVVQLLHDLSNDLANRLYGLDVIFGLLKVLLEVLQREPNWSQAFRTDMYRQWRGRTVLQVLATVLVLPHFL